MSSFKVMQPGPFGSLGNFWTKYDNLADKFDKDMLTSLNTNLDVLLIFAGLFSAVNTAFIIVVLAALTANPLDQTNHFLQLLVMNISNTTLTLNDLIPVYVPGKGAVRQNCTFFASLCCSLLAAAGAMLAKQWLQEDARTGQTGTVEEQARRRADEFQGAERWGLQLIIEALPALLLISLALFFVGLVDYLWTIDRTVAIVVLAFLVVGAAFYGFTLIVGVMYKASPFQTAISTAIRKVQTPLHDIIYSQEYLSNASQAAPYAFWAPAIAIFVMGVDRFALATDNMTDIHLSTGGLIPLAGYFLACLSILWMVIAPIVMIFLCLLVWHVQPSAVDQLEAYSAIWMAETAPDHKHLLTIPQNIPLMTRVNTVQLIARSSAFSLLLSKFTETFLNVQNNPTEDSVADASTMARAISCVLFADPERSWLAYVIFGRITTLPQYFRLGNFPYQSAQATFDATVYLRYCILSGLDVFIRSDDRKWERLSSALLLDGKDIDRVHLSCALRTLSSLLYRYLGHPWALTLRDRVLFAWTDGSDLPQDMMEVLDVCSDYYEHVASQSPFTSTEHTKLLRRVLHFQRHLFVQVQSLSPAFETLVQPRQGGIVDLIDQLHSKLSNDINHLIALEGSAVLFEGDMAVLGCRDGVTAVLERLLMLEQFLYIDVQSEVDAITDTARSVHAKCSDIEGILRGILFRYFLFIVRHLPTEQQREPRIALLKNRSIAPVLESALRLYMWLSPRDGAVKGAAWSAFGSVFRYMACNVVGKDGPTPAMIIDYISFYPLEIDTCKALVAMSSKNNIKQYDGLSPGLFWLAESINLSPMGHWAEGLEVERLVQISVRAIKGQAGGETSAVSPLGMWSRDDGMAAGVLFLRAWDRNGGVSAEWDGSVAHEPSPAWTSAAAIEAFKVWLGGYDGHTTMAIEHDNIVLVSATISHDVVFRFAHHALKVNPEVAVRLGLHEAIGGLVQELGDRDGASAELTAKVDTWKGDLEETLLQARR
ncbi:hypothetical protein FRB93_008482 [Tulasnella sp. JGI-2019a]|nr:hypothetical protein FRB93_008482 [Tulasnella sp. JGI-2019a]